MERHWTFTAALPGAIFVLCVAGCQAPPAPLQPVATAGIESEVALLNQAAYPEESYIVQGGDTPRAIASKKGVDLALLVKYNGLQESSVLEPGVLIVIPRVRDRSKPYPEGAAVYRPPQPAVPREPARPGGVSGRPTTARAGEADGTVRAVAPGSVAEVHRGYPSLGDIVIIESETVKVIYAGSFVPSVVKGEIVTPGRTIGKGAARGSVNVTTFDK